MNNTFLKRSKASVIILGIAMLLLGLAFFINPAEAILFVAYCCGRAFLFAGIFTCIGFFRAPKGERNGFEIFLAICEAILGLWLLLSAPAWGILYISIMIGCVIFLTGIGDIADACAMRSIPDSGWVLWLVLGIITVIAGCLAFLSPFLMAEVVMIVVGVTLVFDGITEIVMGIRT